MNLKQGFADISPADAAAIENELDELSSAEPQYSYPSEETISSLDAETQQTEIPKTATKTMYHRSSRVTSRQKPSKPRYPKREKKTFRFYPNAIEGKVTSRFTSWG